MIWKGFEILFYLLRQTQVLATDGKVIVIRPILATLCVLAYNIYTVSIFVLSSAQNILNQADSR